MTAWIAVLAVGGGSYLFRSLPLLSRRVAEPGPRLQPLLHHASLAAIVALVAAALRHHTDATGLGGGFAALVALAVAGVLSARGRSFPVAVGAGLATALVLTPLLGAR